MTDINFKEQEKLYSQQTLVKILRGRKYYFKPVTEYYNTAFYCIVKCEVHNAFFDMMHELFGWAGFKQKISYVECPVSMVVCGEYFNSNTEPIIFTQEDVKKVLMDVPENYVGENSL